MSADDALSELQLRGIAAASELFDQLAAELGPRADGVADGTDGPPPPRAAAAGNAGDPVGQQQLRAAAARMIDLFAGLFAQTFESYVDLAQGIVAGSAGGVAVSAGAASDLSLTGPAGGNAGTTVWIHNSTAEPTGDIVLRLTDLTSHTGRRIDAALARFVPATLPVAPNASGSSMLSLAIPPRAQPGIYHGHVLAAGLPAAALPVRLVVEAPA
jgi:hypothetical protein